MQQRKIKHRTTPLNSKEKNCGGGITYILWQCLCVPMCVCVCVWCGVRVRVCVCVAVCLFTVQGYRTLLGRVSELGRRSNDSSRAEALRGCCSDGAVSETVCWTWWRRGRQRGRALQSATEAEAQQGEVRFTDGAIKRPGGETEREGRRRDKEGEIGKEGHDFCQMETSVLTERSPSRLVSLPKATLNQACQSHPTCDVSWMSAGQTYKHTHTQTQTSTHKCMHTRTHTQRLTKTRSTFVSLAMCEPNV